MEASFWPFFNNDVNSLQEIFKSSINRSFFCLEMETPHSRQSDTLISQKFSGHFSPKARSAGSHNQQTCSQACIESEDSVRISNNINN